MVTLMPSGATSQPNRPTPWRPDPSAHRRKLNKMTGFPLAKVRKSGLRHDDRPEEIRFDLCAKIRHRRVFDGREIAVSCVVDNNLQRAKGTDRRLHCARCRGLVGHVQREELDLVTVALRQVM